MCIYLCTVIKLGHFIVAPANPDIMESPQGRKVPLRQAYTPDEKLNNTENYEEAIQRQFGGENTLYGRLWWDVE